MNSLLQVLAYSANNQKKARILLRARAKRGYVCRFREQAHWQNLQGLIRNDQWVAKTWVSEHARESGIDQQTCFVRIHSRGAIYSLTGNGFNRLFIVESCDPVLRRN